MRTYSFIMALSITCGGAKGDEALSTTETEASTTELMTGGATSSLSDATPTSTEDGETSVAPGTTGTTASATDPEPETGTDPGTEAEDSTSSPVTSETGFETSAGTSGTETGEAAQAATVEDSCAPNDGAALEFKIGAVEAVCGADLAAGGLRISLYLGDPLAPGVYALDGGMGLAVVEDGQEMKIGTSGAVTIDAWSEAEVVGSYEVTFEDQSVRAGAFVGPHCVTNPACG